MKDVHHEQRRFWLRVLAAEDGCWNWVGGIRSNGYGSFAVKSAVGKWTQTTAHRWSYSDQVGSIPDGYEVDHLCRNRSCVRPDHLEAIPLAENRRRRDIKYSPPVPRGPRSIPVFPKPQSAPKPPPRDPNICRNGHDKRVVGTVPNGNRRTCAECRRVKQSAKLKGGAHGTETHCPHGHPYTEGNIYWRTRPDGSKQRECKTCTQARNRAAYYRRKEAKLSP